MRTSHIEALRKSARRAARLRAIRAIRESRANPGVLPVAVEPPAKNSHDAAAGALRKMLDAGPPCYIPLRLAGPALPWRSPAAAEQRIGSLPQPG